MAAANAHVGVVVADNERHACWIDGRSLGVLSCQGVTEEDAVITGRICQLDTTISVAIKVTVDYDSSENSSRSGRVLTIRFPDDGLIELDASPGVAEPADRIKTEVSLITCLPRWRVVNGGSYFAVESTRRATPGREVAPPPKQDDGKMYARHP